MAKKGTAGWWQGKCDDLMQDVHKTMFDKCTVCYNSNQVGHHFITKSLSSFLRYNFENLIPLCHSCHFKHHIQSDPYISAKIIQVKGQKWYEWIESVRRNGMKTGLTYYQNKFNELLELLNK